MNCKSTLSFLFVMALTTMAGAASSWQVGGCGRGGICPDQYTATPTPSPTFTVSPVVTATGTSTRTPTITGTPPTATFSPTPSPSFTRTRTPVAGAISMKIDVGADAGHDDGQAPQWVPDQAYSAAGTYGYNPQTDAGAGYYSNAAVAGTTDDLTYQTLREGVGLEYRVDLPNGNYRVTLKFCDFVSTASGQRKFNVVANGNTMATELDVFTSAGSVGAAYDFGFDAGVTNGYLLIQLAGIQGQALLNGIVIKALQQRIPLTIFLTGPSNAVAIP